MNTKRISQQSFVGLSMGITFDAVLALSQRGFMGVKSHYHLLPHFIAKGCFFAITVALASTVFAQPNLTPYKPSGWSDKIVVSKTMNTTSDSATLTTADTLYVDWAIANIGTAATGAGFYDALYVDGALRNSWQNTASLNAAYYIYLTNYSIGSLAAGEHTLTITADSTKVISESNELDNSYTKTITILPFLPDLTRNTDFLNDSSPPLGAIVTVSLNITNQGNAGAGPFHVGFYWSTNSSFGGAAAFYEAPISGCATPETTSISQNITISTNIAPGTYFLGYKIDDQNEVIESNESNNGIFWWTVTVLAPNLTPFQPAGWSDTIVVSTTTGTTADSGVLTTADNLYVDWTIINNGNAPAMSRFYTALSVDGTVVNSWYTDPPLAAGATASVKDYPIGSLSAGTHTISIRTDSTGTIPESNENDNSYTKTITVTPVLLPTPLLATPADASGQSPVPLFNWSTDTDATFYQVMIATNALDLPSDPTATNGGPSVVLNAITTNTVFSLSTPLLTGITYYWQVKALNASQYSAWSAVSSFLTYPVSSGLTIIPTFDQSIATNSNASTIEKTIKSALAVYQGVFSDPITVYVRFAFTNSGLAFSQKNQVGLFYTNYLAALWTNQATADDVTAISNLPFTSTNPVNGGTFVFMPRPLARAIGFSFDDYFGGSTATPNQGVVFVRQVTNRFVLNYENWDGSVYLNTDTMNLSPAETDPNKYSLFSAVSHEIDEILGLGSALNGLTNGQPVPTNWVQPEDLFRYLTNGMRSFSTDSNVVDFFSIDGTNDLVGFNQHASGDFSDWFSYRANVIPRTQNAYGTPGTAPSLNVELRALDVIGYTRNALLPPTLFTPADYSPGDSTVQSATPTFTWSTVNGATSYRIMVATNVLDLPSDPNASNGGSSVVINLSVTTTNYTPATPLPTGINYYWQVRGEGMNQLGVWSSRFSLTPLSVTTGFTIVPTFDSTLTSDPNFSLILSNINAAITLYRSCFSDQITVYIQFLNTASGIGRASKVFYTNSYPGYFSALSNHATTADDLAGVAKLPNSATNPVNGSGLVYMSLPLARALGFTNANPPMGRPDGVIYLNTAMMNLTANPTNASDYSLFAVVCAQINNVLGFGSVLNGLTNLAPTPTGPVRPEDLFRYDQNGLRSFTTDPNVTAYFSLDGLTHLAQFNQLQGGFYSDWNSFSVVTNASGALQTNNTLPQIQNAFPQAGTAPNMEVELRVLDVIGYTRIPFTITPTAGSGGTVNPGNPVTKTAGDSQTFTATPNPGYIVNAWSVAGTMVQTGGNSYTLQNIQSNTAVSVNFVLSGGPQIASQTSNATVIAGTTVTLATVATGTAPLFYQWFENGTQLSNATNAALTLTNVARAAGGVYSLSVSNSYGTASSSNMVLRVLVPQRFQTPRHDATGRLQLFFQDNDGALASDLTKFEVHFTTNLLRTNTAWVTNSGGLVFSNGMILFIDTGSTGSVRRFYRVIER